MKQIEGLSTDIEFIDGKKTGATLKYVLSNSIARASHVEAAVAMAVAMRIIAATDSVLVDDNELRVITECVASDQMTANFAKVAVQEALDAAVEAD